MSVHARNPRAPASGAAPLRTGAVVAVVAPSGVFDPQRLEAGLDLIASWGLVPRPMPQLHAVWRYTAGTRAQRSADLQAALLAPDVDAIWFARGGYGTAQLLDAVPWTALAGRPLIGFSDATAAFARLDRLGIAGGLHAPVLHSLADLTDAHSRHLLQTLLFHGVLPHLVGHQVAGPREVVAGPMVGGNLCVLASLCGTPDQLDASGKIVLLEDIAEPPYKIDRMLWQMRASGALHGAVGIALGSFTRCDPPAGADYAVLDVVLECIGDLGVPIVAGLPVGHGAENHPWRVGGIYQLDSSGARPLEVARIEAASVQSGVDDAE